MRWALLASLAVAIAGPVMAQDRMTPDVCADTLSAVERFGTPSVDQSGLSVDGDGWCVLSDLTFATNERTQVRLETFRWRGSDFSRFTEDGLPPRSLEVEGRGFGVAVQTGDANMDYLLGIQMQRSELDFGFGVRWDGVQNVMFVDTAYVHFDETNRIDVTARIDGVDLTDAGTIAVSAGGAGLRDLTAKIAFDGWFEAYVLLPIGMELLDDNGVAPDAQVAQMKRQAIEFIDALPDAVMPEASQVALSEFVTALPTPKGTAQIQISADPVLGAPRAMPLMMGPDQPMSDMIEAALEGVTILVTWAEEETE